jgi:hypothetical protein
MLSVTTHVSVKQEKTENYVCTVTGGLSARADAQLTHSLAKVTTSLALH